MRGAFTGLVDGVLSLRVALVRTLVALALVALALVALALVALALVALVRTWVSAGPHRRRQGLGLAQP